MIKNKRILMGTAQNGTMKSTHRLLGHLPLHWLIHSHRSLICLLSAARLARALRCAHSLTYSVFLYPVKFEHPYCALIYWRAFCQFFFLLGKSRAQLWRQLLPEISGGNFWQTAYYDIFYPILSFVSYFVLAMACEVSIEREWAPEWIDTKNEVFFKNRKIVLHL